VNLYINDSVCLDKEKYIHAFAPNCQGSNCNASSRGRWIEQYRAAEYLGCAPGTTEDGECHSRDLIEKTYIYPRNHRYDIYDREEKYVESVDLYVPDCR
jgi:hypothetical protein